MLGRPRRTDRRRAAQGLRPCRPGDAPADLHHRLPPAAGARRRVRDRPGTASSGVELAWPADALVVCSFGDASANHSTAPGRSTPRCTPRYQATAAAAAPGLRGQRHRHQRPTPPGWIEAAYGHRPWLALRAASTATIPATLVATAAGSCEWVRANRAPAFLHLRTVRFIGHAGTDVEAAYRSTDEVRGRSSVATRCRHRPAAGRHGAARAPSCWRATTRSGADVEARRARGCSTVPR